MKKYIDKVTVTGASDDTSLEDMVKIQKEYPYVEWGILLSRTQAGRSWRFPSFTWINRLLISPLTQELKLSCHLCGSLVNEILLGIINDDLKKLLDSSIFDSVQINTHGVKHKWDAELFNKNVLLAYPHIQFIFQNDEVNSELITKTKAAGIWNISALYDLSHGAGVLPDKWDDPLDGIYTGYAGGLSPDNLESQLEKLDEVVEDKIVWIDAETHLRSNGDVNFDLDKVVKFLEIAKSRIL